MFLRNTLHRAGLALLTALALATGTLAQTVSVGVPSPLPIAKGGTGTSSIAGLRSALGACGTVTISTPCLDLTQTWSDAAVTFTGIKFNVIPTASASGSLLLDLRSNGLSKYSIDKNGQATSDIAFWTKTNALTAGYYFGTGADLSLTRDAANTLAQRNGTAAQKSCAYNTYTDAANYERLCMDWQASANNAVISSEFAGTGTARSLIFNISGGNLVQFRASAGPLGRVAFDSSSGSPNAASVYSNFGSTASSTSGTGVVNTVINSGVNQSGTAKFTDLLISSAETSLGSGGHLLIDAQVGGASRFNVTNSGGINSAGSLFVGSGGSIGWSTKGGITQATDGAFTFSNNAATNSVTASVGANNALTLNGGLITGTAGLTGSVTIPTGSGYIITSRGTLNALGDGIWKLSNLAGTDFTRLILGANDASGVAFVKNGTQIDVKLGDGSAFTTLNTLSVNGTVIAATGYLRTSSKTVATLTAAATAGAGARSYVTDSNATLAAGHGNTVAGGGANSVPVVSDGTNWIIGDSGQDQLFDTLAANDNAPSHYSLAA